ncbi:MAG: methionyl-tRNA formyltransferase [Candidatus Marinimicrobia bacterium]|nr:methionyl-tRNA formyltransferase [Candidatus Neomarinimicrobiota bacterium]
MRIGFITCVQLGHDCIEAIHSIGGSFSLFVTLKDSRATTKSGRVYLDKISKSSGTPLVKVSHINDKKSIEEIRRANLDWLFIVGWSQIANSEVLALPRLGVLGMHPTLLPQGRGRASIPWAIMKGLSETGVTLFKLDNGVDTGPILGQIKIPIKRKETATSLYKLIANGHCDLIKNVWLNNLIPDIISLRCQDDNNATIWPCRKPEDGQILTVMSMEKIDCIVRATTKPYPGAFFLNNNKKIIIWNGKMNFSFKKSDNSYTIPCSDGFYLATEYEIESM